MVYFPIGSFLVDISGGRFVVVPAVSFKELMKEAVDKIIDYQGRVLNQPG